MHAARAAVASGRRFRRARGLAAGLVAAFGALCAHVAAGGDITLVPGLAVLAVTLPLATLLTRIGRVDVARLALVALAAQVASHVALMMSPTGSHHHHLHEAADRTTALHAVGLTPSMALTHLAVVAATTAVAAGLDRSVVAATWAVLGWLLLPLLRLLRLPVADRRRIATEGPALRSQTVRAAADPRGPPRRPLLPLPLLRIAH